MFYLLYKYMENTKWFLRSQNSIPFNHDWKNL
jgi:hypothetical protein